MGKKAQDTDSFSQRAKRIIKNVPRGKVATYGQIAALAGNPLGARQIVRILHSSSKKDRLPWQRIVNRKGQIALKPGFGYEEQKQLLEKEGVSFSINGAIDLKRYGWKSNR
jgi:methylated-DNA-protein-cysteine methyltransferase-like protein